MDILGTLHTEWSAIANAPWSFVTAIVIVGGVVWAVLKWRYNGVIGHLRERVALRNDQIEALREKAENAPTPEAAGIAVRTELEKQQPRALTGELLTGRWELNFNPEAPGRRKLITFLPNGSIGEGRNRNEHTWRLDGAELIITRETGALQNKFAFNADTSCFVSVNDPNAEGIRDQRIYRP